MQGKCYKYSYLFAFRVNHTKSQHSDKNSCKTYTQVKTYYCSGVFIVINTLK